MFVSFFVVLALHGYVDTTVEVVWFLANAVVIAIRFMLYKNFINNDNKQYASYYKLFFISSLVTAIIWGTGAVVLFSHDSATHQVFLAFVYGGISSGALVAFGAFKKMYIAYILCYLLPLVYSFMMYGGILSMTIITSIVLYILFLAMSVIKYERIIVNGMMIKYENTGLINDLGRANAEVEQLNNRLKDKLEVSLQEISRQQTLLLQQSKLAAMGEMIGNIAHQWRQPLNALGLVVQDIDEAYKYNEVDQSYIDDFTKKSMAQINYMSKTIDDFRDFVKPDGKTYPFEVVRAINEAILLLQYSLNIHRVECSITSHGHEIFTMGNVNEFKQVILNLIGNSVDAIKEKSIPDAKIEISVEKIADNAIIKVKDNGGGIPAEILERVFEPYFTTKEEGCGTGVGLYMSHAIICKKMEGVIEVKNDEKGAVFTIKLPLLNKDSQL